MEIYFGNFYEKFCGFRCTYANFFYSYEDILSLFRQFFRNLSISNLLSNINSTGIGFFLFIF